MKPYLFILFLTVLFCSSCVKKECKFPGGHEFELSGTLSPANSTFRIGDTISIVSEFSDTLFDRGRGRNFVLENWGFRVFSSIVKIDTFPSIRSLSDYFEMVVDEKYTVDLNEGGDVGQYISGDFNYANNSYSLAFKFVAKELGLYHFEFGADPGNGTFEGKCDDAGTNAVLLLNNSVDNNIDLLNESPDEHFNTWMLAKPQDRFHDFGSYVFRVEE